MKKILMLSLMVVISLAILITIPLSGCNISSSKEPIKVGAPLPLTGDLANDGLYGEQGIMLAIDELNAKGGVLGRQLQIDKFDIEYLEVEKVIAAADALNNRDGVSFSTSGYAGLGPDIEAFGKYDALFFHGDAYYEVTNLLRDNPGKYTNTFNMIEEGGVYSPIAFENDIALPYTYPNKDVVLIHGDFGWEAGVAEGYRAKIKELGWNIVIDETVPYGIREWTPILTKIRDLDPQPGLIIMSFEDFPGVKSFMTQFLQNPVNAIVDLGWIAALPEFVKLLDVEGNGVMAWTGAFALPNNEGNQWIARYKEKFNRDPGSLATYVYDSVMMWANAAEKVGKIDHKAIKEYIQNNPYKGVSGVYDYRGSNVNMPKIGAAEGELPMPYWQIQDGKLVMAATHTNFLSDFKFITPPWIK